MVAAHRVFCDLGKAQAAWHAGLEELPAAGVGGDAVGPGHGSAGLPSH